MHTLADKSHETQWRYILISAFIIWSVLCSFEFWILGPHSFFAYGSAIEFSLPGFKILGNTDANSQFIHEIAGGNDRQVLYLFGDPYISLEVLLLKYLPLGVALFIHKFFLVLFGMVGTYLLCKEGAGANRQISLICAAYFPISFSFLTYLSLQHGFGYTLIPWIIYLVLFRRGQPGYAALFLPTAALYAISSSPTHSLIGLCGVTLAIGIARNPRALLGAFPSFIVLLVFLILNWHESLYGKMLVAPFTHRGIESYPPDINLFNFDVPFLLQLAAVVLALAGNHRSAIRIIIAIVCFTFLPFVANFIVETYEWARPLRPVSMHYLATLKPLFSVFIFAMGCHYFLNKKKFTKYTIHAMAFMAVAVTLVFFPYKWLVMKSWLATGGLSGFSQALKDLENPSWLPEKRVRVVSVPYRLNGAFAAAAGLDTLDATLNLSSISQNWKHILDVPGAKQRGAAVYSPHPGMGYAGMDYRCCKSHEIKKYVSTDLLRIMNVGYILSVVPLHGDGIVQVSGPTGDAPIPLRGASKFSQIIAFSRLLVDPLRIRVYAIGKPLPRVYAATSLVTVPYGNDTREFYDIIKQRALGRVAVVSDSDAGPNLPQITDTERPLVIDSWTINGDVVSMAVSGGPGYVVLNIPYTPFWTAFANDVPKTIYPVNGAQMMAVVPKGTRTINFKYSRPMLRDFIYTKR